MKLICCTVVFQEYKALGCFLAPVFKSESLTDFRQTQSGKTSSGVVGLVLIYLKRRSVPFAS